MNPPKSNSDTKALELANTFEEILSSEMFSPYIYEIAELIAHQSISRNNINAVLQKHGLTNLREIKGELLDLVITYMNRILSDHVLTENEQNNVKLLKLYFNISEGDFYRLKKVEIGNILSKEFWRLYEDNKISTIEAIYNVGLQELFDLSYDQFDSYKASVVRYALARGANITDLDTAQFPKYYRRGE